MLSENGFVLQPRRSHLLVRNIEEWTGCSPGVEREFWTEKFAGRQNVTGSNLSPPAGDVPSRVQSRNQLNRPPGLVGIGAAV
jgi:hypothetical protein